MNPIYEDKSEPAEDACHAKALAKGQTTFTLISQDITADLIVDCWANAQRYLIWRQDRGDSLETALTALSRRLFTAFEDVPHEALVPEKISDAFRIAAAMTAWPDRRIAD